MNIDDILTRIMVFNVASTAKGLVKFIKAPPVTADPVQGVDIYEVLLRFIEHELDKEVKSIVISEGINIVKYPPIGIGCDTLYCKL